MSINPRLLKLFWAKTQPDLILAAYNTCFIPLKIKTIATLVCFDNYMSFFSITTHQKLPITLAEAWDFFSSPKNLKTITPAYMGFEITSNDVQETMYAGQIITYKVKPLLGIPMSWMTEISHVEYQKYFVDEQRFGPYALWHHKHFFKTIPGGVEIIDKVDYKLPLGILGSLANTVFVRKKLQSIFDYRSKKLNELFGEYKTIV